MYVPAHFAPDEAAVHELLTHHGAADLITASPQGLLATMLPFVYGPQSGEHGALIGHMARVNDHWRQPAQGEALIIIRGPDAYVTPNWYPSKAEHHRAVPTWNYVTAHVYGHLIIHDDPAWTESQIRQLTNKHEADSARPWSVDDAPEKFIHGQLRAIVGIELAITRIEAKFKLSQNRPEADVAGVIEGLQTRGDAACAAVVRASNPHVSTL
jgi:transcriptional regulator